MSQAVKHPDHEHDHEDVDRLLDGIRQYLRESQVAGAEQVELDSALSANLGLDSLGRLELVSRIERLFNISLPDYVAASAESPRDLLRAIRSAPTVQTMQPGTLSPAWPAQSYSDKPVLSKSAQPAPYGAKTLVEVMAWHVQHHPDRPHLQLCNGDDTKPLSYEGLYQQAKTLAAGLQNLNIQPGECVSIMLPTSKEYFFSFLGILLAGAVPVPLYPPANPAQLEDHMRRHVRILNNCQAPVLITIAQAKKIARLLQTQVTTLRHVTTVEELYGHAQTYSEIPVNPEATAFIQYTSGSTGNPKGVVLSHANLLANIRAMGDTVNASPDDVFVSWLPLYHDMGLIGAWLGSIYYAYYLAVMSPLTFLHHPEKWLWTIHQYKGTLSAAPNFGYELCIRRLDQHHLEDLDLSSWRGAFNGAETVSASTMERFYEKFRHYGLQRETLMPVYGLAENSLGLAFSPIGRGMKVDNIKRATFMRDGKAIPAEPGDKDALQFVSAGYPLEHHQIRIVDSANHELPERHEGRLQFYGPSSTSGYYRNTEQTKRLFHDRWLDSGDLAYIANGEVYLTGRVKDVIIRAGRNIYPHELEECVGNIEGIRAGRVTAFGSTDPGNGTERLVIVAETRETDDKRLNTLRRRVSAMVNNLAGTPPDEIVLAPPNTILKTSSGKLRRAASRELFEQGKIGKKGKPAWLQILHFATRGISSELRKLKNSLKRLAFGLYARTIFWLLAAVTWLGVVALPSLPKRWSFIKTVTAWLAKITATPVKVFGLHNLPPEKQACIYVANHASYLDGPVILHSLPNIVRFVAKSELKQSWLSRWFLNRVGAEYIERFDLEKSLEDLSRLSESAGEPYGLFFFPEGTFVRRPGILPFHLGAFVIAAKNNLPVVPITIRGTRSILRSDTWLPHRGSIHVYIGEAIDPNNITLPSDTPTDDEQWARAKLIRNAARNQILRNSGEPDLRF
jgi:1-acyl-sn-glycerol-3-phosphate acyltransferase